MLGRDVQRLRDWLAHAPRCSARLLYADEVGAAVNLLAGGPLAAGTMVVRTFARAPVLEVAMRSAVEGTAEAARALWPAWYGRPAPGAGGAELRLSRGDIQELVARTPRVLDRWLAAAAERVAAGKLPLVHDVPLEVQAQQLSLAIDPRELTIVLALERPDDSEQEHHSFARCAEWLADKSEARVIAVVPRALEASRGFDPISYAAHRFPESAGGPAPGPEPAIRVVPVVGRPHPLSDVEQRLASMIARDAELAPLFEYNQRLQTVRSTHATVDLLWRAGRLVVEIDGYETHGNRYSFAADRQRDYELVLSGYLVLRLTNQEVREDCALALDKIKDLVRLRGSGGDR